MRKEEVNMRIKMFLILCLIVVSTPVIAAEFKPYPGANIDQKATKEATELLKQSGMAGKATIYTTSDTFEKGLCLL